MLSIKNHSHQNEDDVLRAPPRKGEDALTHIGGTEFVETLILPLEQ